MIRNGDFLKAIIAQPADDAIRLVYADWLEEQGESERAELIRVQIELARLSEAKHRFSELRLRASQLMYKHQATWKAELPPLPEGASWGGCERGFVNAITSDLGPSLSAITEETLNATPYECLHLHATNRIHRLSGSPLLARTRMVSVQRNSFMYPPADRDDALLREILSWPECSQWRGLSLHSLELSIAQMLTIGQMTMPQLRSFKWGSPRMAEPLLNAPWLGQLEELELVSYPADDDQFRRLWTRLSPQRLRRLTVRNSKLSDAALDSLVESGLVQGLTLLDLENNNIGSMRLAKLLSVLAERTYLSLDSNPLGDDGLVALANSPAMLNYTSLPRLRGPIGDRGLIALAQSPKAKNLVSMYYNHGTVGSLGLNAVLNSPMLSQLRSITLGNCMIADLPVCQSTSLAGLHLSHNQLTDHSIAQFARESLLPQLEYLNLENNKASLAAAQALANSQGFPKLKSLMLRANPLGEAGGMAIMQGAGLPALKELHLEDCQLTDRTLQQWRQSPRLKQLEKMHLQSEHNHFSRDDYESFCEHALEQGCNVDYWASRPRLTSIRRPTDGSPLAVADRIALAAWINGMFYPEYARAGWLKVATIGEIHQQAQEVDQAMIDDYRHAPTPAAPQCRAMLHYFLEHWMSGCVPESVSGGWGLSPDEFERRTLTEIRPLVDEIIETSCDEQESIEGVLPHYIGPHETPRTFVYSSRNKRQPLSYEHMRRWFLAELFDPATAIYMVHDGPPRRIIGMDPHVIAQLWLD